MKKNFAGVCSLREFVEIFGSYGTEWRLTCFASLLVVPWLFAIDVSVCLGVAGDDDVMSFANTVALVGIVGDNIIISLTIAVSMLTAGVACWLGCAKSLCFVAS